MLWGVAGRPVLHSRSPQLFSGVPGVTYLRLAAESPSHALRFGRALGLAGINVTAPFKGLVGLVDRVDDAAEACQAVNTVVWDGEQTRGFNTDVEGVRVALAGVEPGQKAVILGSGGAARAALVAVRSLGLAATVAARRPERASFADQVVALEAAAEVLRGADVIVDCLSSLDVDLPEGSFRAGQRILVANYAGSPAYASAAQAAGVELISGHVWLAAQAAAAASHFGLQSGGLKSSRRAAGGATSPQPGSIVLVGISGSGKSTVGRALAEALGWEHLDLDQIIVDDASVDIPTIFAREGEVGFRRREREAVARVAGLERAVISTGGGTVVDDGNRTLLAHNNLVIWLHADPETAATRVADDNSRPLLTGDRVEVLRRQRDERRLDYAQACDLVIDTAETPDVVRRIVDEVRHAFPALG